MKAITIHQPWAWLIMAGYKKPENRQQGTGYRGPIAIHAGGRRGAEKHGHLDQIDALRAAGYPIPDVEDLDFGQVLGTVDLVDCVPFDPNQPALPGLLGANDPYGLADDPLATGPVCLILADPKPFDEPIPARGQQGIWEWDDPQNA